MILSPVQLLATAEASARAGARVVRSALAGRCSAVTDPQFKGVSDLVTQTDLQSERAVLSAIGDCHPTHVALGEEGGLQPCGSNEAGARATTGGLNPRDLPDGTLWAIDPLDGTTNFVHGFAPVCVSVAALQSADGIEPLEPVAACVIEFVAGVGFDEATWPTRVFTASSGGGARCNGVRISCSDTASVQHSLLATGFGYEHGAAWSANMELFRELTDASRGVRRAGSAAADLCAVGLGTVDAFWEFDLKPWDQAAGMLVVREAGGDVLEMDGSHATPFTRKLFACNGSDALRRELTGVLRPAVERLQMNGCDLADYKLPGQ